MSTGAPAMTSMYAAAPTMQYGAPATYAAAPTMTSMYATPGASMYMPAATQAYAPQIVETVAAPQQFVEYAAPQQVMYTQAPSYVAAPVVAAPVVEYAFPVPVPLKLTEGLVPPAKVEAERLAYEKALAAQLKKQSDAVFAEAGLKKQMMEQAKKTQLAQFQLQVEEQLKLAGLAAEQEAMMMVDGLKEAAITQQTAREEAAARAVADFNKKKSLEEYQAKSWGVQKNWFEQEQKLTAEYQAAMKEGSRVLGNYNAGQVNVNAPGRMASYTAAPQYTTVAAAPQYTTVAAPQMTYGAPMMQTIAAPVVEIDQVNAVGQVVERDFVGATTMAAPQITYGAPQYTTVAAAPQYATVAGTTMMAPQTFVAA